MCFKNGLALLFVSILILSFPPHGDVRGEGTRDVPFSGLIDSDTTWAGNFHFANVTVAPGATLTIASGSVGHGLPGARIYVEGALIAGNDSGPPVYLGNASSSPWGYIQVNSTGRAVVRNTYISNSTIALYSYPGGSMEVRNSSIKFVEKGLLSQGPMRAEGVTFEEVQEDALTIYSPENVVVRDITVIGSRRGIVVERPINFTLDGADISEVKDVGVLISGGGRGVLLKGVRVRGNGTNYPTIGMQLLGGGGVFSDFLVDYFRSEFLRAGLQIVGVGTIHINRTFSLHCGMDLNVTFSGRLYANRSYMNSYGGSYFRHLPPGRCDVFYYDSYADSRRIHTEDELTTFTALRNITVGALDQMGRSISFNLTVVPYGFPPEDPFFEGYVKDSVKLWLPLFSKQGSQIVYYQPYNFTFTSGGGYLHVTIETAGTSWWKHHLYPTMNLPAYSNINILEIEEDGLWRGTVEDFFTDPDGVGNLTLLSAEWGEGINVTTEGENITIKPQRNWHGESWVTITVRDEYWNLSALEEEDYIEICPVEGVNTTSNITVTVLPSPDPPVLLNVTYLNGTPLGKRMVSIGGGEVVTAWIASVLEDTPEEFIVRAEDPDGEELTLELSRGEGGEAVEIVGGLAFTFTPPENSTEGGLIRLNLTDSVYRVPFWVLFEVIAVNDPPSLPQEWNITLQAGQNISIDLRDIITDSDTPFEGFEINVTDGVASYDSPYLNVTPPPTINDEVYHISITVVDGEHLVHSTLTVHVRGTGEGPEEGDETGEGEGGGGGKGTNLLYIILGAVALLIVLAALLLSRRGEREAEE